MKKKLFTFLCILAMPMIVAAGIDSGHPYGNVIVKAGHTLSIKRHAEINLNGGFSVEKGAKLVIQ